MGGTPKLDSVQTQGLLGGWHVDLKHLYRDQTSLIPSHSPIRTPPEHVRSHGAGEFGVGFQSQVQHSHLLCRGGLQSELSSRLQRLTPPSVGWHPEGRFMFLVTTVRSGAGPFENSPRSGFREYSAGSQGSSNVLKISGPGIRSLRAQKFTLTALHSLDSGQRRGAGESEGGSHFLLPARVSEALRRLQGQDHSPGLGTGNSTTMLLVTGVSRSTDQLWLAQAMYLGSPLPSHASVSPV